MRIGLVSIEMVHSGSGEHFLTAFADGEALMSVDSEHCVTDEPIDGERLGQIQTMALTPVPGADLTTTDPLEEALLNAAEDEWPTE